MAYLANQGPAVFLPVMICLLLLLKLTALKQFEVQSLSNAHVNFITCLKNTVG